MQVQVDPPPAIRLEKYDLRGFCIAVPGFDAARLSRAVLDDEHIYLEKFDILLRPKTNMESPGTFEMPLRTFSGGQIRTVRQQIEAAKVQTCETCRGFERLCVLKYGKVTVCRAGGSSSCGPLSVHRDGMHTLVYCTSVENIFGDDDEYTASPLSSVKALLREHADHEIEMANAGAPQQADFEWWKGGAMQKFAVKPLKECVSAVRETMATCFHAKQHLQFVYDIVESTTPFHTGNSLIFSWVGACYMGILI